MMLRQAAPAVLVGGFAYGVTQGLLLRLGVGWFLDSGLGVSIVFAVLALVAVVRSLVGAREPVSQVIAALSLVGGAAIVMSVTLLMIGPGSIFPIVLLVGAIVIAVAVTLGSLTGLALAGRR